MDVIAIRKTITGLVATIVLSVTLTATSLADDIPLVDGKLWLESSIDDKHSYLIGISNFLAIEYAYQKESKQQVADGQSIVRRFFEDTRTCHWIKLPHVSMHGTKNTRTGWTVP